MRTERPGFTLIEVIVAMLILTTAVLAMGASAGYILRQVRAAELRTQRMLAVRQAAEQLYATEWTNLEAACGGASFTSGRYSIACSVSQVGMDLKEVQLVSTGPGYRAGTLVLELQDTMAISVAEPYS